MKRTRVSLAEKGGVEQKQNCPVWQPRQTMVTTKPRLAKKHVSGSMVNTQGKKRRQLKKSSQDKRVHLSRKLKLRHLIKA